MVFERFIYIIYFGRVSTIGRYIDRYSIWNTGDVLASVYGNFGPVTQIFSAQADAQLSKQREIFRTSKKSFINFILLSI